VFSRLIHYLDPFKNHRPSANVFMTSKGLSFEHHRSAKWRRLNTDSTFQFQSGRAGILRKAETRVLLSSWPTIAMELFRRCGILASALLPAEGRALVVSRRTPPWT